jgi:hypothetical protein
VDELEVPDFGTLEILGRRVSRPFSFSLGFGTGGNRARVQSQIIHSYTVRATEPGTYVIRPAAIVVGGRRVESRSLSIRASGDALPGQPQPPSMDPGGEPAADDTAPPEGVDGASVDRDAFLRTVVDKARAHVGEQVTVTVYLYVRGNLMEAPSITQEPTADGFWVQDLLPPNRTLSATRQRVQGRTYNVYVLRRFAAFPLRAGQLEVGPMAVELGTGRSLFDLLSGPSTPARRTGVPVTLEVLELPPRSDASRLVHVGALELSAKVDRADARVGDAITLELLAEGRGNLKALRFDAPRVPTAEVLAPEVDDEVDAAGDRVGGKRRMRWLLLPREPGKLEIPSFEVDVFDPATGSYTRRSTAPIALDVTGRTDQPQEEQAPPAAADASPSDGPRFGPIRTTSALLRKTRPLHEAPWFIFALLAGPALLGLSMLYDRFRRRRALAGEGSRAERAAQRALAKLEEAKTAAREGEGGAVHAALAVALRACLESRLAEPVGGLTYAGLRAHLTARGMTGPLVERLVAQLEASEQARFNPLAQGTSELDTAIEKTRGVLRELERFTPEASA